MAEPNDDRVNTVRLHSVDQIGIVVKDAERAAEYYRKVLGLGDFAIRDVELKGLIYRGQAGDSLLRVAFLQSGPVQIELIQVLRGDTPHTDFLRQKGEGLHHLKCGLDDFAATAARLRSRGVEFEWYAGRIGAPAGFAYVGSPRMAGTMLELVPVRKDTTAPEADSSAAPDKRAVGKARLGDVRQIGIVVKNVRSTADYFHSTFGIGPFGIIDVDLMAARLRGRPVSGSLKVAFAQWGPLQIEFIQPVEGESIYAEFLESRGEGPHHLAFVVEDMQESLAHFSRAGIEPVFYDEYGSMAFASLDTAGIGGVTVELLHQKRQSRD
ncbi:MAG: VOC family protein [Chloroflexi bacterium]|nr:VOC family protein [Chloroflexota bacterium]